MTEYDALIKAILNNGFAIAIAAFLVQNMVKEQALNRKQQEAYNAMALAQWEKVVTQLTAQTWILNQIADRAGIKVVERNPDVKEPVVTGN